ncbi:hypothetical protein FRC06_004396 [Ceratobasidium sp. 370]|nr:hypothetical protein FRC06_004396 [Ceratobasidium sp. 370]
MLTRTRTKSSRGNGDGAQLRHLQREADRLARLAEESPETEPSLYHHPGAPKPVDDSTVEFRHEAWDNQDTSQKYLTPQKGFEHIRQRTLNSWALVEPDSAKLVMPKFAARNDQTDNAEYRIVGFASPINDGARRASRALSGRTPLFRQVSHPDVWQMQTKCVIARVKTPFMGEIIFFGCRIPCVIFRSATEPDVEYAVQSPDRNFKPYWNATIARWAVQQALSVERALVPWQDVDLAAPRPWFMNKWAMTVLRLEHGIHPTHPDDPVRPAMLGACRRVRRRAARRAPTTAAEWAAIPVEQCDPGDDEEGESDAGSINDDVERGLPTSATWNPITKKSETPRGTEPHAHPQVVEAELARNRRWDETQDHVQRLGQVTRSESTSRRAAMSVGAVSTGDVLGVTDRPGWTLAIDTSDLADLAARGARLRRRVDGEARFFIPPPPVELESEAEAPGMLECEEPFSGPPTAAWTIHGGQRGKKRCHSMFTDE